MTAETTTPSLDATDAALAAAILGLDDDGQRLATAVLRLLSAGEPVPIAAAAAAARMPVPQAEPVLRSWPAVFWDDHGRVTGFGAWPWPRCHTASGTPGLTCTPGAPGIRCSSPTS